MNRKIKLKIPIVGNPRSGKSAFIHNLAVGQFLEVYTATQGYHLTPFTMKNNNNTYQIMLWDCGTEHFTYNKHIRSSFFRNASATIVLFDLCDKNWQSSISEWVQEVYRCECYLVYAIGTKKDRYLDRLTRDSNKKRDTMQKRTTMERSTTEEPLIKKYTEPEAEEETRNMFYEHEYQINQLFSDFQLRHYYQSAKEKISHDIKHIFISIHDDRQKLSRSSLARGIKFDNTIVEEYMHRMQMKESVPGVMGRKPSLKESGEIGASSSSAIGNRFKRVQILEYQNSEGIIMEESGQDSNYQAPVNKNKEEDKQGEIQKLK